MRVLILTALLACASAAPSGSLIAPLLTPAVAIPAAIPTIPPGDIEAAAIDAKVAAEDQARALAEQAIEQTNEKITENNDVIKEKTIEAFWNNEDKRWQAYDALNTAQAEIDGNVASAAPLIAKSALTGAFIVPPAPILGQIVVPPVVYAPGIIAPKLAAEPSQPEKVEEPKTEAPVDLKAAELPKIEEPVKNELKVESSDPKILALSALPQLFPAPLALAPALKYDPWLTPITYVAPGPYAAALPSPILAPAVLNSW